MQFTHQKLTYFRLLVTCAVLLSSVAVLALALTKSKEQPSPLTDLQFARKLQTLQAGNLAASKSRRKIDPQLRAFGELLFFDTELSSDGSTSCASCHQPQRSFTDGRRFAKGIADTTAHTPTIIHSEAQSWFFWDGRVDSLAAQALGPIENPLEQGTSRLHVWKLVVNKYALEYARSFASTDELTDLGYKGIDHALPAPTLAELPKPAAGYALASWSDTMALVKFLAQKSPNLSPAAAVSDLVMGSQKHPSEWYEAWKRLSIIQREQINKVFVNIGRALAAYELSIDPDPGLIADMTMNPIAVNSDVWQGGKLFFSKANCHICHSGYAFSDGQFHNTGLPGPAGLQDMGRARGLILALNHEFPCLNSDPGISGESCRERPYLNTDGYGTMGAFKTPTLRNVAKTAPYMHDGSFETLAEVVNFYNDLPGEAAIGHREESLKPLGLSEEEQRQLLAFLEAL